MRATAALLAVLCWAASGCAMPHTIPGANPARVPSVGAQPTASPVAPQAQPSPSAPAAGADGAPAAPEPELTGLAAQAEAAAAATPTATAPAPNRAGLIGADASWPQCPAGMGIEKKRSHGAPMPLADSAFVVLGLTNGPGFTPNPCLADQVKWVRERSMALGAYSVLSQPSPAQLDRYGGSGPYPSDSRLGRLRNAGFAQATFNLDTMRRAGMLTPGSSVPGVWLDVEPVPDFDWGSDLEANAAVVQGAARGYAEAGLNVGIYSTPALWRRIVGELRLGLPEWRAAGQTSAAEARSRCGADWVIQGGSAVWGQWVEQQRDRNLICPGAESSWDDWLS